jgi:hypothetical protein
MAMGLGFDQNLVVLKMMLFHFVFESLWVHTIPHFFEFARRQSIHDMVAELTSKLDVYLSGGIPKYGGKHIRWKIGPMRLIAILAPELLWPIFYDLLTADRATQIDHFII